MYKQAFNNNRKHYLNTKTQIKELTLDIEAFDIKYVVSRRRGFSFGIMPTPSMSAQAVTITNNIQLLPVLKLTQLM